MTWGGLNLDPVAAGIDVIIYGHSHQASVKTARGVKYINPGSAGLRRFNWPISIAILETNGIELEVIPIEIPIED
ncbi:MAG: metallophosphoesterase family protein [Bacteroidales bacterium]|nr:metallophosphoesterase family protein [Bacteroidales bacterium]